MEFTENGNGNKNEVAISLYSFRLIALSSFMVSDLLPMNGIITHQFPSAYNEPLRAVNYVYITAWLRNVV